MIRVLRKVFSKRFFLSDAEDNTSGLLDRGGIEDLPLLRTVLALYHFIYLFIYSVKVGYDT